MATDGDSGKPHPNKGRKHSPEHIARRVAAVAAAKAKWTAEQRDAYAAKVAEANRRRDPEKLQKFIRSGAGKRPWNKGNNWRDSLTAEEVRARQAAYAAKRRAANGRVKMNERFAALIRHHLKVRSGCKNRKPWPELVAYDAAALEAHLRSTLPPDATWEDYLRGDLHLDHIIPVAAHNFTSADDFDFRRCWALSNLRLIWKEENLRKGSRLSRPFQPALAL